MREELKKNMKRALVNNLIGLGFYERGIENE